MRLVEDAFGVRQSCCGGRSETLWMHLWTKLNCLVIEWLGLRKTGKFHCVRIVVCVAELTFHETGLVLGVESRILPVIF